MIRGNHKSLTIAFEVIVKIISKGFILIFVLLIVDKYISGSLENKIHALLVLVFRSEDLF